MKIKSTITFFILLFQTILAFSQTNSGAVIFNLKFSSFNETGFGGKIKIINTATQTAFTGKSSNRLTSQIAIQNLPKGNYSVVELTIRTGSGQINYLDSSKFNQIEIYEGRTSYLGMYKTKKSPPIFKLNYEILSDKNIDVEKIKKQSLKITGSESEIDFSQKLLKSDTTYFSIKF